MTTSRAFSFSFAYAFSFAFAFAGCTRPPQPSATAEPGKTHFVRNDAGEMVEAPLAQIADGGAPVASPSPLPEKVRVVIYSNPRKARVSWGKKQLGTTPVVLERPRDSGPIDLIVRKEGYFPLHTRAYTFRNDTLHTKLTALEDRMTIYGAKAELPAAEPGCCGEGTPPDGGVPAPLPSPSPSDPMLGTPPPALTP